MIQRERAQGRKRQDIIGWVPKVTLEDGLRRAVDDFVSQPGLVNG